MKISKLFHWLYAVLMFLPLLVFLPTGFYYAFNDNAHAQEYTRNETFVYETNEVNSADDLIIGHVYTITRVAAQEFNFDYSFINYIEGTRYGPYGNLSQNVGLFTRIDAPHLSVVTSPTSIYTYLDYEVDFVLSDIINTNDISGVAACSRTYTYQKDVTYTMGITDSMVNAWNHTWELPLFSWSEQTFLNVPFNYITGLFSIPNGSTFSNAFGYWLSISICWLVFDVIMYVPMLAHRWIDKARIE